MLPAIVVIGSLNMDIVIEAERYPQVGETILGHNVRFMPGGKGANQAVAAARLGGRTTLIGAVGADRFGQELLQGLDRSNVNRYAVKQVNHCASGMASVLLARKDNCIVVVPGANEQLQPKDIDRHVDAIRQADVVLVQMEIPLETVIHAIRTSKSLGKTVVLNPAPVQALPQDVWEHIDYLTPNRSELFLLAYVGQEDENLEAAMQRLLQRGVRHVVTTLGKDGCVYMAQGSDPIRVPAYEVEVADTTGAGDAFSAGLAYAIASGESLEQAVVYATAVSSLAVTKLGAQEGMPDNDQVRKFLMQGKPTTNDHN